MPVDSFSEILITNNDILEDVRDMNSSSAPGADNMHACFIKRMVCYLVLPLKIIFNKSIQSGCIPYDWRAGIIVPLYKNNKKPEDPASYRPVCLTSNICKLLERVILK